MRSFFIAILSLSLVVSCSLVVVPKFDGHNLLLHYVAQQNSEIEVHSVYLNDSNHPIPIEPKMVLSELFRVKTSYAEIHFNISQDQTSCSKKMEKLQNKVSKLFYKNLFPANNLKVKANIVDAKSFHYKSTFNEEDNSVEIYFPNTISSECKSEDFKYFFYYISEILTHELYHFFGMTKVIKVSADMVIEERDANKVSMCNLIYSEGFSKLHIPQDKNMNIVNDSNWGAVMKQSQKGYELFVDEVKDTANRIGVESTVLNEKELEEFKGIICEPLFDFNS